MTDQHEPDGPPDDWAPGPIDDAAPRLADAAYLPPQDDPAERAVLGAMITSADAIAETVEVLRGSDYYRPAHETIHDAIVEVYGRGEPVDIVMLAGELERTGELGKVGGHPYLFDLASQAMVVPGHVAYYAERVAEKARLRAMAAALTKGLQRVHAGGETAATLDAIQADILAATRTRGAEDYRLIADLLDETVDHVEAMSDPDRSPGVPTGFYDLDDLVGGWQPGQMIVVGARPAVGKSTVALDFARAAAIANHMPTAIFSLEMSRTEIVTRLLSAEGKIALQNLRSGQMAESDWARLATTLPRIRQAPLWIDDSANLTMTEIRAKARRLASGPDGLRLIIIDYLQLMSSGKKVESRQLEISEFSRQIKLLAKELEVPVIALSQLNRGVESRQSKRPLLSDLRESGAIEQDSDIVILVHREDLYEAEPTRPGEADLIVAKHRNGPTRDVTLAFQGHYSRFASMGQG